MRDWHRLTRVRSARQQHPRGLKPYRVQGRHRRRRKRPERKSRQARRSRLNRRRPMPYRLHGKHPQERPRQSASARCLLPRRMQCRRRCLRRRMRRRPLPVESPRCPLRPHRMCRKPRRRRGWYVPKEEGAPSTRASTGRRRRLNRGSRRQRSNSAMGVAVTALGAQAAVRRPPASHDRPRARSADCCRRKCAAARCPS